MKKNLFFTFVFVISISVFAEQWPLEKCIDYALKHSKTIRSHIETIVADSAKIIQAKSVFYPNLSAGANASTSGTPFDNASDPAGVISMRLSSGITLFDGRKNTNRLSIAEASLRQNKFFLDVSQRDIVSQTARNYISVLYATETLKNADDAVLLSQKQIEYQQALSEVGKATPLALTKSNAQLSKNKHLETVAQNNLNSAILQIKQLLELDQNVNFEIVYPETDFDEIAYLVNLSADSIYNNKFDAEKFAAQLSVEIAQISFLIAKAGKIPTLSANASISTDFSSRASQGLNRQKPQNTGEQLTNNLSPSVGLSLNIPIVDNRVTKSSIITAQSNLNKAEISLEATQQNVRFQIEQLIADIKAASARFSSASEQFLSETENMQMIEEMYKLGNVTVIDYASQQNNFLSAQSELTQAKYSLMLSQKLLEIYLEY
ncbi:MAG: TolC family protein [Chitinispirillales bacterium]|jgi:outer membrane protein|nr:TolC family protein [Chitinispirillales bacterium]